MSILLNIIRTDITKTNVGGAEENVIKSSLKTGVKEVVALSTDKLAFH